MSIAAPFKHPRPLPFPPSSAPLPAGDYDYVALDETGGDKGLAEARRLWWLLESIQFIPTGTLTYLTPPPESTSFSRALILPLPIQDAEFDAFTFSGVMAQNGASINPDAAATEPDDRVSGFTSDKVIGVGTAIYLGDEANESLTAGFALAFDFTSQRWRLYYRFTLDHSGAEASAIVIKNPNGAFTGGSIEATGTATIAGYELEWEARLVGTAMGSGYGITGSLSFYSF